MKIDLIHGDCLQILKDLPDNSVSSVVCDPPYGLSFMSKRWDYDVPSTEIWQECLRVLKPGGHLLAFGGSRTYHRMAVRIEDAGFEIRDQIMWLYGSGFPKSHNIGKAVDKLMGNEREVVGVQKYHRNTPGSNEGYKRPIDIVKRENGFNIDKGQSEWEGWGTALKPSHEPIVVARKPLSEKSVALNVLKWGTGGINIDVSRVGTEQIKSNNYLDGTFDPKGNLNGLSQTGKEYNTVTHEGRWPANIILDEEAGQILDEQSGIKDGNGVSKMVKVTKIAGADIGLKDGRKTLPTPNEIDRMIYNDKGGASRFFYCAKASKKDRNEGLEGFEEKQVFQKNTSKFITDPRHPDGGYIHNPISQSNHHPTVKPTSLMEYLIKLVTPVNGTVLDPFMGSGSTGKAAVRNGYDFIGIEREEEYINIAKARIENEVHNK
jgi:DNA modification methylase